jgi:hypothetical protein
MARLAIPALFSATGAAAKVHRTLVKVTLFATVVLSGEAVSTAAFAQTNDYLQERCAQLIAYYDYYAGGSRPSEATDGARNHTRISAWIDCDRGNYEVGIKTMEALMTRKHISVPRADVASTPDGRVRPIDTARIPQGRTDQAQQSRTH